MAIEYLGNKTRLLRFIIAPILRLDGVHSIGDLFCGTASVARALADHGLRVVANDNLQLCATLAEAALLSTGRLAFHGLRDEIPCGGAAPTHADVIGRLNALPPREGFFYRTYSPASAEHGTTARMYLTEANAAKVDAIRRQIETWTPSLTRAQRAVLLRDLVQAVTRVSNTAGTYGCYLKQWKSRALQPLQLAAGPPPLVDRINRDNEVYCDDAQVVASRLSDLDAIYLDPPYTKRQYAAYYHLLETLVSGAMPSVEGSTGLPPWQEKQSDFCYSRRAPKALSQLVDLLSARHVFLSYSDDGHIAHEEILEILRRRGAVRWWERTSKRYRSSGLNHQSSLVQERLYHLAVS